MYAIGRAGQGASAGGLSNKCRDAKTVFVKAALCFVAGASTIGLWPELPPSGVIAAGLAIGVAGCLHRWTRLPALAVLGAALALAAASQRLEAVPAGEPAGEDIVVTGRVAGLPHAEQRHIRFRFDVRSARHDGQTVQVPSTVRLSWYGRDLPAVIPGEQWRFSVRLRPPRGFANPGGFDYARWLFVEGLGATGHVRADGVTERLAPARPTLNGLRHRLRQTISQRDRLQHPGMLTALAIGDRALIGDDAWDVLLATGTNHLVAISGLHIGLAAAAGFFFGRVLWQGLPSLKQRVARPVFAAVAGMTCATCYAALAGFAIPTQRALVMLAVGLGMLVLRRRAAAPEVLAAALVAVILFDPLAPLAAGFWLSFGAVAAIVYLMHGRLGGGRRLPGFARLQAGIAVALAPAAVLLFARASLAGPVANLIAVPWVSLVVVPPTLLGTLVGAWSPLAGGLLLQLADLALMPLWWFLQALAAYPWAETHRPTPSPLSMGLALIGVIALLAPRGVPGKAAGFVCLMPLFLAPSPRPAPGAVWLDVLDVGRGVAIVARTRSYTLVHDTGPRLSGGFDGGSAVVVPFLQASGVGRVDEILVSQDSSDHAGGLDVLRAAYPSARISMPAGAEGRVDGARTCDAGRQWSRDGVTFTLIHPFPADTDRLDGADAACVLSIEAPGGRVVLAGDISRRGQWFLLTRGTVRRTDVLATHGGTLEQVLIPDLIAALDPEWVLHTAGQPPAERAAGGDPGGRGHAWTDCGGAVHLAVTPAEGVQRPRAWRDVRPRFWHTGCGGGRKSGTMRAVVLPGARVAERED